MNQPYVKHYDANGKLLNPIKGSYETKHPTRRERRIHKNQIPFQGNGKNYPLTITGSPEVKYVRVRQRELDKDGDFKTILHYLVHTPIPDPKRRPVTLIHTFKNHELLKILHSNDKDWAESARNELTMRANKTHALKLLKQFS